MGTSPAVLTTYARSRHLKMAQVPVGAGGGGDVPFESAMSNLAHAYLRNSAPTLLKHEIGFQLIDTADDYQKAVGVMAFKIGKQRVQMPVFFLHGRLKGHELMYLQDSGTFVPGKEGWVEYLESKQPSMLGEPIGTLPAALGAGPPSLEAYRESPSKYAAAADPVYDMSKAVMYRGAVPAYEPVVPRLVKQSCAAAVQFLRILEAYPTLIEPVVRCYGKDMVKAAIAKARASSSILNMPKPVRQQQRRSIFRKTAAADPNEKLQIYIYNGMPQPKLTEKQAEELKRHGIFVDDKRDKKSTAFTVQEELSLQTPDATGFYDILCHPDTFENCLYIQRPWGPGGRRSGGIILQTEGKPRWSDVNHFDLLASKYYGAKTFNDWFDALPVDTKVYKYGTYIAVTPHADGTCIFEAKRRLPSNDDNVCYEVWWENEYPPEKPQWVPKSYHNEQFGYRGEPQHGTSPPHTIVLGRVKGKKVLVRNHIIYMPPGTKIIKLQDPRSDNNKPLAIQDEDRPILQPGSHAELQLGIYKLSSELTVANNGVETIINTRRMPTKAALISLIREHGLSCNNARGILKRAQKAGVLRARIKYAYPYPAHLRGTARSPFF